MEAAQDTDEKLRPGRLVLGVSVAILAGFVIAVLPAWLVLPFGPRYEDGEACLYEEDPGSGYSATGGATIRWGLVPGWACVPIGPLDMAHSGPEYRAAVDAALQGQATDSELSPEERRVRDGNVVMGSLDVVWPTITVLISTIWLVPAALALVVTRRRTAVRRAYRVAGVVALVIGALYVLAIVGTRASW